MLSGINTICFAASYLVAFALDAIRLASTRWAVEPLGRRFRRVLLVTFAVGGVFAHTCYLGLCAANSGSSPLSSPHDWYLLAAWVMAALYLIQVLYYRDSTLGVFFLPLVLALVGAAQFASRDPFAVDRANRFWGNVHGTFLLLGTVTVMIGFVAGAMYLVQSYRLKRKWLATDGFPLPSLERLEKVNGRSLAFSVLLIGIGFVSGVILRQIKFHEAGGVLPWTDPVVISLALMVVWLIVAELFRITYPAARVGRKVAYLTVASFLLLAVTLAMLLLVDTQHGPTPQAREAQLPRDWQLSTLCGVQGGSV